MFVLTYGASFSTPRWYPWEAQSFVSQKTIFILIFKSYTSVRHFYQSFIPFYNFLQDVSHKSAGTEGMSRREYRRRHYYAKEDSDDEQTWCARWLSLKLWLYVHFN